MDQGEVVAPVFEIAREIAARRLRIELQLDAGMRGEEAVELGPNVAVQHALSDKDAKLGRIVGFRPLAPV